MDKQCLPSLSLGPVYYLWDGPKWRDFYFRIADEAPVSHVILGETVCSKRQHFIEPYLAEVVELDSNQMHAVMMTSRPALFYWQPQSVAVMALVRAWRAEGLRVCYTLDAGANVHCLCEAGDAPVIEARLRALPDVLDVRAAGPGPGVRVVSVE